jgi:hypothetical protein
MVGTARFARFVADRLGIDPATATRLLEIGRATQPRRFSVRAVAFFVAAWEPLGQRLPRRLRRKALNMLLGPMLETPAGINAYAAQRLEAALARDVSAEPCES